MVPLFSKRTFDFANLATSGELDLVVLRAFPVLDFADAVLQIRVHAATIPADASVEVSAQAIAPSCDDPQTDFLGPQVGSVELTSSVTAPSLVSAALSPDFGSHLQVVLGAVRGGTGGTFSATLSGDLVLKPRTAEPALLRFQTQHAYADGTSGALRFIPFIGTTSVTMLTSSTIEVRMAAIHDGWLDRLVLFATSGPGVTTVGLYVNGSLLVERELTVSGLTPTLFEFGPDASFVRGNRVSIGVTPASTPGSVNIQCGWVFRRST